MALLGILRQRKELFGKQVVHFEETITKNERVKICWDELGINSFEHVFSEQCAKRFSRYGLPADIVVTSTELIEALQYEKEVDEEEETYSN
ncbi:hypothetical protein EAF04_007551 [Stromatinia cepivora]|nr:hypothetical protein EAF04_007551 [Stromatinia cepivora]